MEKLTYEDSMSNLDKKFDEMYLDIHENDEEKIKSFIKEHYISFNDLEEIIREHIKKWDNNHSASRKECLEDLMKRLEK